MAVIRKLAAIILGILSAITILIGLAFSVAVLTDEVVEPAMVVLAAVICFAGLAPYRLVKRLFSGTAPVIKATEPILVRSNTAAILAHPMNNNTNGLLAVGKLLAMLVGGVGGFFALIAAIVFVGVQLDLNEPTPPQPSTVSESGTTETMGAWAYIQQYVEASLTVPSSADFPSAGHRAVKPLGDNRYTVYSYVEAENAFGAKVRTSFTATVKRLPEGWGLESLEFQQ